jgi:N4-gp56 family major capsid protein
MAAPNTYTPASYNAPPGSPSSIGPQAYEEYHQKQALIEARREQFFTQLADVTVMPKNMGKKITKFHYIPLLDDRNINDQGIDANGATIANGNLYGSSKDIGVITGKLPALTEHGGRVNRVGFTRIELEGTLEKFGFYEEFTQESLDFDSDEELDMHITREMVNGAHQMSEAALQIDILNAAGVIRYAGDATSTATIGADDLVTYDDLLRLGIQLTNNRTPRTITQINGTRLTDTRTIPGARPLHCGSELIPTLKGMKDLHNNPAFISVEKYAAGGETLIGEIGQIDEFRIIIVPEMLKWAGAGAVIEVGDTANHDNGTNYDVFPMLCIGDGSFTTIGFQTDGKSVKFKIIKKLPGAETADRLDPYGEMGFMAIKWYYGFMTLRSERIGLIKTVARL